MRMEKQAAHEPGPTVGPLEPCPFCGGAAVLEPDSWRGESVRIACGNPGCHVVPRTEYLLACFADELRAAWNGRARRPSPDEAAKPGAGDVSRRIHLA